jgi:hypothetical protein
MVTISETRDTHTPAVTGLRVHGDPEGCFLADEHARTLIHTSGRGFLGHPSTPLGILVPPTTQSCAGEAPLVVSPAVPTRNGKAATIMQIRSGRGILHSSK